MLLSVQDREFIENRKKIAESYIDSAHKAVDVGSMSVAITLVNMAIEEYNKTITILRKNIQ
jgi:hypothetical protein